MHVCEMMIMSKKTGLFLWLSLLCMYVNSVNSSEVISYDQRPSSLGTVGRLVKKEEWTPVASTEFGAISAVDIGDGTGRYSNYHLQFITLEPNSLFLPVLLHADMVFYVHTGSGRLSWAESDEKEVKKVELQRGDVYRLKSGSLFYLHSSLESQRPRLRIIALFANVNAGADQLEEPSVGPYSSINDLVRGFDKKILQAAFQVPEEVIEELTSATDTPAIVHAETQQKRNKFWEKEALYIDALLGMKRHNREAAENKKKHSKSKPFNFFKADPDFHNCNGWSTVVTKHDLDALHGSHIGVYMVNLTKGSMMGPHWNPKATEVSVVLEGEGMVRVVCPSTLAPTDCKNARFRVEEGDAFTVPRFHPMAQISFNNGSLVFMGFSTTTKENHPQFLAGKASVLQTLDRLVLGASFNVLNTTIDQLLAAQKESIILDCTSCAEEEEMLMEKEIEEERREEEERRREQEERRRREEEEEQRRRKEEEEKRRREEEEEQRRREEEEVRRRKEEEERRREKEEEQQRREEEEERRRTQEEEEQRRHEEEEEQKRREEEEERRRQEEHEQRRQEEEKRRREEEEEQKRREEEERRQEEKQQQKEEQRRREEERRKEEEQRRREKEEQRQQEEEERQREEEERRMEEEAQRRHEAEEEWKQEEEKRRRKEAEEERRKEKEEHRQEEEWRRQEERRRQAEEERRRREERGGGEEETEEAAARREEEERVEKERQEEEAARRRREHERREWELVKVDKDLNTGGNRGDGKRLSRSSFTN